MIFLIDNLSVSEAFSVDDSWAWFVIFGSGDPHGLEGGEGWKNWATNPDGEFSFGGSNNLDFHCWRGKGGNFFAESFRDTSEHGGTTGHDDVSVEVLSDINVAFHDGFEGQFVDTRDFHSDEAWLEQKFRGSESLCLDGDDIAIREFVGLVIGSGFLVFSLFSFVVEGDVAQLFLDISDDFTFGGWGEGHT